MQNRFDTSSDRLEGELRASAPRPDDEFVASLVTEIPRQRRARSRSAFASAVTVMVLGSLASFGGIGYAAEGASKAAAAAEKTLGKTSASDQYSTKPAVKPASPKSQSAGVAGVASASTPAPARSTLPFTGLSLVGTVGLGLALLFVGFALRRRENV